MFTSELETIFPQNKVPDERIKLGKGSKQA